MFGSGLLGFNVIGTLQSLEFRKGKDVAVHSVSAIHEYTL